MATGKTYTTEQSLGTIATNMSQESSNLASGGYPNADFYIENAQAGVTYRLYRRDGTEVAPTVANPKGYIDLFWTNGSAGRTTLHGVPLVENQTFYVNSSDGVARELRCRRYTWDDSV